MKISLIHPSRSRPEKAFKTVNHWFDKGNPTHILGIDIEVEYILSIDKSDPSGLEYAEKFAVWKTMMFENSHIVVSDNNSVVEATNKAAKKATGDVLVYLSDDFSCPPSWNLLIQQEFKDATTPRLVKVDDMLQKFDVPVLTIPIMNRALYERLGYFFHPEYKSMHVDCDLYETVKRLGALKLCPHLKFPHEHVSIGKAPMDETYRRSSAHWDQGLEVFRRRQKQNFPA